MPDLNTTNLMPSPEDYKALEEKLQKQLADKLAVIDAEQFVPPEKPAIVDSPKKERTDSETTKPTENAHAEDGGIKDEAAKSEVYTKKFVKIFDESRKGLKISVYFFQLFSIAFCLCVNLSCVVV